jgi:hypothetical protein
MKTLTLNGVPYTVDQEGNVFAYGSTPPVPLGTYDSTTKILTLLDTWSSAEEATDFLAAYRTTLKEATTAALEKAKQQQQSV